MFWLVPFEMFMEHMARKAGIDPIEFKLNHLVKKGQVTAVSGKFHDDIILPKLVERAMEMAIKFRHDNTS